MARDVHRGHEDGGRIGRSGLSLIGRATTTIGIVLALAAVAFVLVPAQGLNSRSLVQINGSTYSLPSGTSLSRLDQFSRLAGRPGSLLDITGDVIAIGQAEPPLRSVNESTVAGDPLLTDGSIMLVAQGRYALENVKARASEIPFESKITGSGPIVRLAQEGRLGKKEVFTGSSSGRQAAVFILEQPQSSVVERSSSKKPGEKLAALTFDDGPGPYTQAIIDALAAKHVPATFFMLGSSAAGHKSLIADIRAAGHEVENHSWSHPQLTKVTPDVLRSEISRTSAAIGGAHFLRPPYGTYNAAVAAEAANQGLAIALWTVDTLDWKYQDVDQIMARVRDQTKPGAIILMHDGGDNRAQTAAAIPRIVDWLFANGYSLTTVAKLL